MYDFQDKVNPKFTHDHPFNKVCLYCSNKLEFEEVSKISKVPFKLFYKHFFKHGERMKKIHGRFDNKYFQINHSLNYEGSHNKRCLHCGWWSIYDEYWVSWVSDITYLRTSACFIYLSLITDTYSRKIVGYHLVSDLKTLGCIKALNSRLYPQRELIHHSDRGTQCCCDDYTSLLKDNNIQN